MKLLSTLAAVCLAFVALAGDALAHFVWIHVLDAESGRVAVYFGEGLLERSDPGMARHLTGLELIQNSDGGAIELRELELEEFAAKASLPLPGRPVRGELTYGWMGGPDSGSLLVYHAVGARTLAELDEPTGARLEILAHRAGDLVELRVLFDGRPAPGAEVVFTDELLLSKPRLETDGNGELGLPIPRSGPLLVRAKVIEEAPGQEHEGRSVSEVLHYATLTVANPLQRAVPEGGEVVAHQRLERAISLEDCWGGEVQQLVGRCRVTLDDRAPEEFELSFSARDGLQLSAEGPETSRSVAEEQLGAWFRELGGLAHAAWLGPPVTELQPGVPNAPLALALGGAPVRVELAGDTLRFAEFSEAGGPEESRVRVTRDVLAREQTAKGKSFVRAAAITRRAANDGAWLGTDLISNSLSEQTGTLLPVKREVRRSTPEGDQRIRLELSGVGLKPLVPSSNPPARKAPASSRTGS